MKEDNIQDYWDKKHIFFKNNTLYVLGEFNQDISNNIIPEMQDFLIDLDDLKNPKFEIVINSPGGYTNELYSLLSYLDLMKKKNIKIITRVIGDAHSCASILACYGDERYMSKYSNHLLHYGNYPVSSFKTPQDVDRLAEMTKKDMEKTIEIYSQHSRLRKSQLRKFLANDNLYLDAKTCLDYGLCDFIV